MLVPFCHNQHQPIPQHLGFGKASGMKLAKAWEVGRSVACARNVRKLNDMQACWGSVGKFSLWGGWRANVRKSSSWLNDSWCYRSPLDGRRVRCGTQTRLDSRKIIPQKGKKIPSLFHKANVTLIPKPKTNSTKESGVGKEGFCSHYDFA